MYGFIALQAHRHVVQWGDVATWVTAAATLAAAAGAFVAARIAYGQLQDTRRELRRQEDRRVQADRQAPAEQVTAWTGPHTDDCARLAALRSKGHSTPYHFHSVMVRNGGEQPVFDVVVLVPMVADRLRGRFNLALGLLPPNETAEHRLPGEPEPDPLVPVALDIWFTDIHGVRWHRNGEGRLAEASQEGQNQ